MTILCGFEANAQLTCAACKSPALCAEATFVCPTCNCDNCTISYTVCYTCSASVATEYTVIAIDYDLDCFGQSWLYWTCVVEDILKHHGTLCDVTPCDEGNQTITIIAPICVDVLYYYCDAGYKVTISPSQGQNCNESCSQVYSWCKCNCVPNQPCNDPPDPGCVPHVEWTLISSTSNGTCSENLFSEIQFPPNPPVPIPNNCRKMQQTCE